MCRARADLGSATEARQHHAYDALVVTARRREDLGLDAIHRARAQAEVASHLVRRTLGEHVFAKCHLLLWREFLGDEREGLLDQVLAIFRIIKRSRHLFREVIGCTIERQGNAPAQPLTMLREVRADQYGVRTVVQMDGQAIKFEIVREARIALEAPGPGDVVCGISTLTRLDLAASKLLANSDRHADDGVFSRDVLDLAMMDLRLPVLREAMAKSEQAYGPAVARDLATAIDRLQKRQGWLERCMQAMAMTLPKAVLWQKVRTLRKVSKAN